MICSQKPFLAGINFGSRISQVFFSDCWSYKWGCKCEQTAQASLPTWVHHVQAGRVNGLQGTFINMRGWKEEADAHRQACRAREDSNRGCHLGMRGVMELVLLPPHIRKGGREEQVHKEGEERKRRGRAGGRERRGKGESKKRIKILSLKHFDLMTLVHGPHSYVCFKTCKEAKYVFDFMFAQCLCIEGCRGIVTMLSLRKCCCYGHDAEQKCCLT